MKASGEIDLQSPSYFPPGTTFDVRFEFVSVENDIYTSNTYHLEHLGTAHDWQRVSDDILEIVYYGLNRRSIENLHSQVASRLPEISSALGVTDSLQYRAVIFPNLRELTIHGPRISQAATDGTYFGGFAYDTYNLTIMSSPSAEILVHELTHLIFARKFTSPYATAAPGWLNEGNPAFGKPAIDESHSRFRILRPLGKRQRIREDGFGARSTPRHPPLLHPVRRLRRIPPRKYDAIPSANLLDELNREDIDQSMQTVFGGTLDQIENEWRREWRLRGRSAIRENKIISDIQPTCTHDPGLPPSQPDLDAKLDRTDQQIDDIATPQPEP